MFTHAQRPSEPLQSPHSPTLAPPVARARPGLGAMGFEAAAASLIPPGTTPALASNKGNDAKGGSETKGAGANKGGAESKGRAQTNGAAGPKGATAPGSGADLAGAADAKTARGLEGGRDIAPSLGGKSGAGKYGDASDAPPLAQVTAAGSKARGAAQVLERAPVAAGAAVTAQPAPVAAPKAPEGDGVTYGSAKSDTYRSLIEKDNAAREVDRGKQTQAASKLTAAERAKALSDVLTTTAAALPGAAALGGLLLSAAGPAGWLAAAGLVASASVVATGLGGLVMSGWYVTTMMQLGLSRLNNAIAVTRAYETPKVLDELPALALSPKDVMAKGGADPKAALTAHRGALCAYRLKVHAASEHLAKSALASQDSFQHATKLASDVVKFVSAGGLPFLMFKLFRNALPPELFGSVGDPAPSYERHGDDQWSARDVVMASSGGELAHAQTLIAVLDSVIAYVEALIMQFTEAIEQAEGGGSTTQSPPTTSSASGASSGAIKPSTGTSGGSLTSASSGVTDQTSKKSFTAA